MKSVCLQIMMAIIWVNTEIKITQHDYSLTSECYAFIELKKNSAMDYLNFKSYSTEKHI